jgi:hypothetical protein
MPVTYRVHENAVLSYMDEVDNLVWNVLRSTRDIAKRNAPVRTGRLRDSIRASRPRRYGVYQYSGTVSASVKHALWVHDGTTRIYPKSARYLTVPVRSGSLSGTQLKTAGQAGNARGYFLARSVSGQRPQPYLANALRQAMGTNNLLYIRVS